MRGRYVCAVLLLGVFWSATAARAQESVFPPEEYRERWTRLFKLLGDDVLILKGAPAPQNQRAFRQYNTFWYFTGYEGPDAVLVADGRTDAVTVYVPARQIAKATRVLAERGIARVRPSVAVRDALRSLSGDGVTFYVQRFPGEGEAQSRDSFSPIPRLLPGYPPPRDTRAFRASVLNVLGEGVSVRPAELLTDPLRRVKSSREIDVMREAARIAAEAIRLSIQVTRPGIRESALAGICEYVFRREGARCSAWTPIVASGPNMVRFHYMQNSRTLQPNEMLLLDAGPDYYYYTSDVTRCWPSSGPFPDPFDRIYDKLVEVHRAGIAAVKPGNTPRDVATAMVRKAREVGLEGLLPIAGHYTGMAAHDVGSYDRPFQPGVVFNVEPLWLDRRNRRHLRLEDTVLCTENGPEVLTPLDLLPWDRDAILRIRDSDPEGFLP